MISDSASKQMNLSTQATGNAVQVRPVNGISKNSFDGNRKAGYMNS